MSRKFSKTAALGVASSGGLTKISSDPKRNQTVLHLSTLGAIRGEQNNTFVDDSPNRYTITRTGNVAPSTFTPFGDSWSNYFDGNGDYLSVADNAAFELDTGDFTIEAWVNSTVITKPENNVDGSRNSQIIGKQGAYGFGLWGSTSNIVGVYFASTADGTNWTNLGATQTLSSNTWYHIAAARQSGVLRIFIDGVLKNSGAYSNSIVNLTGLFVVGGDGSAGTNYAFTGHVSNARIVKGTALYTSDFTPSKSPLTAVSGTSLLTCASNRFGDKSSNNFTITPAGNVAVKTASPFPQAREFKKPQRGWCIPFNGSTQRLETPAASVANGLQLGTSDFTIEFWIKGKPQSGYRRVMDCGTFNNTNYGFTIVCDNSLAQSIYFEVYKNQSTDYNNIPLTGVLNNVWNHVAIVRTGDVIKGYVNGEYQSTFTLTSNNRNLNYVTPITMGCYKDPSTSAYSGYFSGKISNVMIVKKALYSSNFVPMQSPRTADQNGTLPVLLTCQGGSIIDYSYSSQTLTSAGSLVVDSDGPFDQDDELSYYFDGTGDYLSVADNAALELGAGDFTIEMWVKPDTAGKPIANGDGSYTATLFHKPNSYGFTLLGSSTQRTGLWWGVWNTTISNWDTYFTACNIDSAAWNHVCITRQSSTFKLFLNGQNVLSQAISGTTTFNDNANALAIGSGGAANSDYAFNGNISNFRIVKGTALYTSSFTPSRKPLPAVSGTSLLTCRGRTAIDDSTNALTVTVYGTAGATANPVSTKSPFRSDETYGMSCYFDGNGDYLSVNPAITTPFAFGTGDHTIEGWIYPTSLAATLTVADFRNIATSTAPLIDITTAGVLRLYHTSGTLICSSASGAIKTGQWNHFAISRSGTSLKMFVNGNQEASVSNSSNIAAGGTSRPFIGQSVNAANRFAGYIAGLSVQKGVAKYTAAFTPPTSPQLTGDFSQSLLLNAYPAIYDTTRKNAIETVGSYAAANIGPPWGIRAERYAVYFGGSTANDYLTIPYSPDFDLGTGDFTIETWVYIAGNSLADGGGSRVAAIVGCYGAGQGWYFSVWGNSTTTGNGLGIEIQNSSAYVSAVPGCTVTQNVWNHIAVTRKNGIMRFFLNGVQQGSDYSVTAAMNGVSNPVMIGRLNETNYNRYLFGGLYDLRITKGFARYTANFTLANSPLPIK